MGSAEDAIRLREELAWSEFEERNRFARKETIPKVQPLAAMIARELDRLGWPNCYIRTVRYEGASKDIATYQPRLYRVSDFGIVGSDGVFYYNTEFMNPNEARDITMRGYEFPPTMIKLHQVSISFIADELVSNLTSDLSRLRSLKH